MVDNVGAFIGTWNIGQLSNPDSHFQTGWTIVIGTGDYGATPPVLTDAYNIVVGFAVLNAQGVPVLQTGGADNDPLLLLFTNGTLRYAGYYDQRPLRIYIAMAEALIPTVGTTYPAIYGTTMVGDPDQVGVWGADGNTPPH